MQLFGFAILERGDLQLRDEGSKFAQADVEPRKEIFAAALRAHVPLAALIEQEVRERRSHRVSAARFRDDLEEHMSPDYAEDTLHAVIGWGRYGELFSFDEEADQFFLEEDEDEEAG